MAEVSGTITYTYSLKDNTTERYVRTTRYKTVVDTGNFSNATEITNMYIRFKTQTKINHDTFRYHVRLGVITDLSTVQLNASNAFFFSKAGATTQGYNSQIYNDTIELYHPSICNTNNVLKAQYNNQLNDFYPSSQGHPTLGLWRDIMNTANTRYFAIFASSDYTANIRDSNNIAAQIGFYTNQSGIQQTTDDRNTFKVSGDLTIEITYNYDDNSSSGSGSGSSSGSGSEGSSNKITVNCTSYSIALERADTTSQVLTLKLNMNFTRSMTNSDLKTSLYIYYYNNDTPGYTFVTSANNAAYIPEITWTGLQGTLQTEQILATPTADNGTDITLLFYIFDTSVYELFRLLTSVPVTIANSGGGSSGSSNIAHTNLHLAQSGYGVGIGQYSTGTLVAPRFDCAYPAYFPNGLTISSGAGVQFGQISGDSTFPGQTNTKTITFDRAFSTTPFVFLTLVNDNTSLYAMTIQVRSVSTTQFTIGVAHTLANASTDVFEKFKFNWLAIGT